MSPQEAIIRACAHQIPPGAECRVRFPSGEVACCCECWNASVSARRAARKAQLAAEAEAGRAYWAERGIQPGDQVKRGVRSMLGWGGMLIHGTAKVGAGGAYVSAPQYQRGKLAPEEWAPCA